MFFPEVRQPSGSLRGELQAECAHDLKHSAEPRIAVLRQRLIEPLAGQARVLRKLHHAAGARDVTKRLCQQRRVIRRFLETCLEVGHHIGFGFEVVSSVLDSVAGTVIDTHFAHARADRPTAFMRRVLRNAARNWNGWLLWKHQTPATPRMTSRGNASSWVTSALRSSLAIGGVDH